MYHDLFRESETISPPAANSSVDFSNTRIFPRSDFKENCINGSNLDFMLEKKKECTISPPESSYT